VSLYIHRKTREEAELRCMNAPSRKGNMTWTRLDRSATSLPFVD
jgi:hypothetical protein